MKITQMKQNSRTIDETISQTENVSLTSQKRCVFFITWQKLENCQSWEQTNLFGETEFSLIWKNTSPGNVFLSLVEI